MKVKKIIPFEEFEKAVMHKILGKKNRLNEILLEQYGRARVIKRDFTAKGFFTDFEVPADVPSVTGLTDPVWGNVEELIDPSWEVVVEDKIQVTAYINDGAFDCGFVLFLKNGKIDFLEGYVYVGSWPKTIENYELKYDRYN